MKTIYVYENWLSDTPSLIGRLYVDSGRDNWGRIAKRCGLSHTDIEDKRPAFNACYEE